MDANVVGNDEFVRARPTPGSGTAASANALPGSPTDNMICVRVSGNSEDVDLFNGEWHSPGIDMSFRTFRTQTVTSLPSCSMCRIAGADNARYAEFAGNDRRMGRATALVGHNRRTRGA